MTDDKKSRHGHIIMAHKNADIPEYREGPCPKCNGPTQEGFGLAGGGYGSYTYCEACEEIVSKSDAEE